MKKLMILAATAATALAACAAPLDPDTATEAQIRAVLAEATAKTNSHDIAMFGFTNGLWKTLTYHKFASLRAEADDALSALPCPITSLWSQNANWPKVSAIARRAMGVDVAYPKTIEVVARLGANMNCGSMVARGATLDDLAVFVSEAAAFPTNCSMFVNFFEDAKLSMQRVAQKSIRRLIRMQGKSFVTKNGVNPCEEYMNSLTTALNAPRFAGLDAWLKGVGFKGIDLSALPSAAEVAELREQVMNGDKEMRNRNKAILYVCLGVEGYNAFVREYNGE